LSDTAQPPKKERFAWPDDANLMRAIFFGLLIGTLGVLYLDFVGLTENQSGLPTDAPMPILPAIERPEVDPNAPQFNPTERISVPQETLDQPLTATLMPKGILRLEGRIDPTASARIIEQMEPQAEYIKTIVINSPGGSVRDAIEIGRYIRGNGFTTQVERGGYCASSCPLVFAAGKKRVAEEGATIGVHQIYGATADVSAPQAMSDAQITTAEITRYLDEMGVDPSLWLHALDTPPQNLYYFTAKELKTYDLATN
jgi:hypothetical protein